MSCQIVTDTEIYLLAGLLTAGGTDTPDKISLANMPRMSGLANMLKIENHLAFNKRYPSQYTDPVVLEVTEAVLDATNMHLTKWTPLELIKIAHHYIYQTCEYKEFKGGRVDRYLKVLVDTLVTQISGYDDAPWGI